MQSLDSGCNISAPGDNGRLGGVTGLSGCCVSESLVNAGVLEEEVSIGETINNDDDVVTEEGVGFGAIFVCCSICSILRRR